MNNQEISQVDTAAENSTNSIDSATTENDQNLLDNQDLPNQPKDHSKSKGYNPFNKLNVNKLTEKIPHNFTHKFTQNFTKWFQVSDEEVAEILTEVRGNLPTTEALLIGKPQAGKSSLVRGLTGVSADIVGQGFRPHTQYTNRYAYPSNDLPLLIFTDTVGLGDINQDTEKIIRELSNDLEQTAKGARIFILTVKINDFATDSLRQIVEKLRAKYPYIPCLLAITCLHEIYPPNTENHPAYPPDYSDLVRASQTIAENFAGLYDRMVLVDFTLEDDGYDPVFYGRENFCNSLAELLPEAEAKAIYQLLDEDVSKQIGNLYRDTARHYILPFAIMAGALAAVPLPLATMPVLTSLQVSMVTLLGKLYGQNLTASQAGGLISAIAGGFLAQMIGRELLKFIPVFGSAIAASWATAYTWALGEGACVYFGDLMGGKKPDPAKIQLVMQEALETAKTRFQQSNKSL